MIKKENQKEWYVIIVKRGNQEKYISNKFYSKNHINCTYNPSAAHKFDTLESAISFWDNWGNYDKELKISCIPKMVVNYYIEAGVNINV